MVLRFAVSRQAKLARCVAGEARAVVDQLYINGTWSRT
jgi:hypothetical protein